MPRLSPLRYALITAVSLATLAPAAESQSSSPEVKARLTRLFSSDSVNLAYTNAVSMSPDGRWVAYSDAQSQTASSLWMVPAAGGAPVRLTQDSFWDTSPMFFPSGDQILFISNRPSRGDADRSYVMVLRLDPKTGRPVGSPRQVTLDPVWARNVRLSPDGRWIAYLHGDRDRLMVIPSEGGAARTIARWPQPWAFAWSPDSRSIVYVERNSGSAEFSLMRLAATGGEPVQLHKGSARGQVVSVVPEGRYLVTLAPGSGGVRQSEVVITSFDGATLGQFRLDSDVRPASTAFNAHTLVAGESNTVAPLRMVPISGGKPRAITPGTGYDWPYGWLPSGTEAVVQREVGDRMVLEVVPIGGGKGRSFQLPAGVANSRWDWAVAGNHGLYSTTAEDGNRTLVAVDLQTGATRKLTENATRAANGVGGRYGSNGNEFLFVERQGAQLHLRAANPTGTIRTLRSFPASVAAGMRVWHAEVHGEKIAWPELRGDSLVVLVAEGATGRPRQVYSTAARGRVNLGFEGAWSHDGRLLAMHLFPSDGSEDPLLILEVPRAEEPVRAPRALPTGYRYWYQPRWLPDDSGVVVLAGGAGWHTHVLLVPLRTGATPIELTQEDPSPKWGYELSPDGRWVIYPAEISRGSALWKIDLSEVVGRNTASK